MEFALFKTVLYWSFECVEGSIPFAPLNFFLMRLQVLNSHCNLTSKHEMVSILAAIRSIVVKNASFQLSRQGTVLQEINNN